jgi:hypothetical protein
MQGKDEMTAKSGDSIDVDLKKLLDMGLSLDDAKIISGLAFVYGLDSVEEFSCYRCSKIYNCRAAWDFYNTAGDCLMEK